VRFCSGTAKLNSAPSGKIKVNSFLSTSAGSILAVLGVTFLGWEVADFALGPWMILQGMTSKHPLATKTKISSDMASLVAGLVGIRAAPAVNVVTAGDSFGKKLETAAFAAGRPVIYISLREAVQVHDLLFSIISGVYSSARLGLQGTAADSMGVWWMMILDRFGGRITSSSHFQVSIVLRQLQRALRECPGSGAPRPLVIVDYFQEAADYAAIKKDEEMKEMLLLLTCCCNAACFDNGVADVVFCDDPVKKTWVSKLGQPMKTFTSAAAFRQHYKKMMTPGETSV
jgi:hypothetical protein